MGASSCGGSASAAGATVITNAANGRNLHEGIGKALLIGAAAGAAGGACGAGSSQMASSITKNSATLSSFGAKAAI